MDKDVDAFRTISEVAEDLDLPQHVLRFWEMRFPQIKPMKRSGGRRYYRPEDIDLLRGVKRLLYGEGYTIKGVQRILKEQGARAVTGMGRVDASGLERVPLEGALAPRADDGAPEDEQWRDEEGGLGGSQARLLRLALAEVEECARLLAAARET